MKLLLDQNLSHRLIVRLAVRFPGTTHVRVLGLERATDELVWDHAKEGGFVIVTKDGDFRQRSYLLGAPPKVVWLCIGNCTSDQALQTLLRNEELLAVFEEDEQAAFLTLP